MSGWILMLKGLCNSMFVQGTKLYFYSLLRPEHMRCKYGNIHHNIHSCTLHNMAISIRKSSFVYLSRQRTSWSHFHCLQTTESCKQTFLSCSAESLMMIYTEDISWSLCTEHAFLLSIHLTPYGELEYSKDL